MEENIKQIRKDFLDILNNKKVTFYEWERIRNYINEKYEQTKSTL